MNIKKIFFYLITGLAIGYVSMNIYTFIYEAWSVYWEEYKDHK